MKAEITIKFHDYEHREVVEHDGVERRIRTLEKRYPKAEITWREIREDA